MSSLLTGLNVQACLRKWSEVTALSLGLMEASLKIEFPGLKGKHLRHKLIERLNAYRDIHLTEE